MSTTVLRTVRHRIAPVWDPATGKRQAEVQIAERADVDALLEHPAVAGDPAHHGGHLHFPTAV